MVQKLLVYTFPKETVIAIMIGKKDMNVMVRSPGGDTDFFDVVTGDLLGYTLVTFASIICVDYVQLTSIDLMKEKTQTISRRNNY